MYFTKKNFLPKLLHIPFFLILAVFFISFVFGIFDARQDLEGARQTFFEFAEAFAFLESLDSVSQVIVIFLNNAVKSLVALLLGIFFAIAPVAFVWINGFFLGQAIAVLLAEGGSFAFLFLGLVPHGIFELFGVFVASAYGVWLGGKFFRKLRYHEPIKIHIKKAVKNFCIFIVPLLILAAIIEIFITPLFFIFLQ